jgi:hypothetical protein
LVAGACLMASGCGGSTEERPHETPKASGGSGGTGGSGPFDSGVGANCNACKIPSNTLGVQACCRNDAAQICGWKAPNVPHYPFSTICHEFDQPGTRDSSCHDYVITFGASLQTLGRFAGCCRADGVCGADLGTGFGCVAHADLLGGTTPCTPP